MSEQAARDFIDLVRSDRDLASRMTAAASPEERLAIAKDAGYEFTEEEYATARGVIPDEELEVVSGSGPADCQRKDVFH